MKSQLSIEANEKVKDKFLEEMKPFYHGANIRYNSLVERHDTLKEKMKTLFKYFNANLNPEIKSWCDFFEVFKNFMMSYQKSKLKFEMMEEHKIEEAKKEKEKEKLRQEKNRKKSMLLKNDANSPPSSNNSKQRIEKSPLWPKEKYMEWETVESAAKSEEDSDMDFLENYSHVQMDNKKRGARLKSQNKPVKRSSKKRGKERRLDTLL